MGSWPQAVDESELMKNLKVDIIMLWLVAFHGGSRELFFLDMLGGQEGRDFNHSF